MKKFSLFALITFFAFNVTAQNGVLDASFNSTGKVNSSNETANSICVDKDMKTLVLGHDRNSATKNIFLTRYNSNGTVDNSFGSSGQFNFDINTDYDYGRCVKALSNGKYLICGQNSAGPYFRAFVLRVNNNGTIDNTFGKNGVLIIQPNNFNCDAWAMDITPSGSIYMAGYMTISMVLKSVVWKIKPNGKSLDSSFGQTGGIWISTNNYNERLYGIDLDMVNNRIALVGVSNNSSASPEGIVCLVDTNGNSINSFNGNSIKKIVYNGNPTNLYDVCLKSSEVIVNGNCIINANQKALVSSLNLDGTANLSFASNGYFADSASDYSSFSKILVDCKGDIYNGGNTVFNGYRSMYLLKMKANGTLDNSFASNGVFVARFNTGFDEVIEGMAFYSDSAIVAGGRINIAGSGNVASGIMRVKYKSCSNTSSIDDLLNNKNNSPLVVLYPNPLKLNEVLNIQTDLLGNIEYAIYSSDGKLVANASLENGETEITETSTLAPGFYHMVMQNARLTKRLSFVVE